MKNRRIFTSIIFVLLASATCWILINRSNSTIKKELKDFAVNDTGAITKIVITDKNGGSVSLVKQKMNEWKVNDKYYARMDGITGLLQTMKQMEVRNIVSKNIQDNVVKSLASSGKKVEVYNDDELVKLFYVGGETQDLGGTFMLLADPETKRNSTVPFEVWIPGFDGFLTPRFFISESDWRDRTIFRYIPPQIRSVKVEYPDKPNDGFEIEVSNKGNSYQLRTLIPSRLLSNFDTASVKQYLAYFQNLNYEVIEKLEKTFIDSVTSVPPLAIISLTDVENKKGTVKIFYKPAAPDAVDHTGKPLTYDLDRIFAYINNDKDFVTIQYFSFGKILQPVGYFSPKGIVKK